MQFVRPVHGLVALHGARRARASVLGLAAGRDHARPSLPGRRGRSRSRRPTPTKKRSIATGGSSRRSTRAATDIERQLRARAAALGASLGDEAQVAALLDEVTALVEWPTVYVGEFEREFLEVPQECLILTMRTNQKYFPLFDARRQAAADSS